MGIVVAAVVVLAGAGAGTYFGFRGGGSDGIAASSTTVSSGTASTLTAEVSTTVTIPDVGSSTTEGATVSTDEVGSTTESSATTDLSGDPYLRAVDTIVTILEKDDQRIPQLATTINNAAPKVPTSVDDELDTMLGELDGAFTALAEESLPAGFEESDGYLQDAANAMGNRIDATINGVRAMRNANSVNAGSTYFDLGRQARDDYRAAYQNFQDTYPVE